MTEVESSNAGLSRPLWFVAVAYALAATLAVCLPAWPGQMSYDSLFAYRESVSGIENLTWPPLHAYLYWLSRNLGAGVGGLFALQTFILFFSAAVIASLMIARRALVLVALAIFAGLFVVIPPLLGVLMTQWRDVLTGGLALAVIAFWLLAARRRSLAMIAGAALMLSLCMALRYNAFPLFGLLVPMMVWRPFLTPGAAARDRVFTAVSLAIAMALALASMTWRLPDLKRPERANTVVAIQLFDLIGVSACTGHNYLPPAATGGWPLNAAQLRQVYDPRHLLRAFRDIPGVPHVSENVPADRVQEIWRKVIPAEFDCYLVHRTAVFIEQMGIAKGDVFYPVHGGIDPNPYGLKIAHPRANQLVSTYVVQHSPSPWRRPGLLYLAATLVVLALAVRRDRWILLEVAILAGAYGNVVLLYFVGPAADARYVFDSNLLCAILVAIGLIRIIESFRKPA